MSEPQAAIVEGLYEAEHAASGVQPAAVPVRRWIPDVMANLKDYNLLDLSI